jgi:hypothetical protein
MKRKISMKNILIAVSTCILALLLSGCEGHPTSDDIQRTQQEKLLQEGTAQIGMPSIKNFREKKLLKDIIELRDQAGLITYTYMENQTSREVKGKTALGGKLTYVGESIGYGIPYATQFTNPQKIERYSDRAPVVLPQADPNGLFSPVSAEGTWIQMKNPNGNDAKPVYFEPKMVVSPFKYPMD